MPAVSPYRVVVEDLPDLDKKTRLGLQPLLDALNIVLGQVVSGFASIRPEWHTEGLLTTDENGAAYVDVTPVLPSKPSSVEVNYLRRTDSSDIAAPYGMTWGLIASGPRLLFVGLDVFTQYNFRVTVK